MKLKELGEFGFIEHIKPLFDNMVEETIVGIGDDCAIIPGNSKEDWIMTTDLLIEGVHFLMNAISAVELGHKSLAVSLSDIAAMGGTPVGSFLSLAIPSDIDVSYMDEFMLGYHALSERFHTPLLGGDTTNSLKHFAINVCVIGCCPKGMAIRRNMAKPGDVIAVTGMLGDSAAGLKLILDDLSGSPLHKGLIQKHHMPEPRINEGKFLLGLKEVNAMMDISDGLASDLKHIIKASAVSASIKLDSIPVSDNMLTVCNKQGWNAIELAICGGEDYELLFTVPEENFGRVQKLYTQQFGENIYPIGIIEPFGSSVKWYRGKEEILFFGSGFDHFK